MMIKGNRCSAGTAVILSCLVCLPEASAAPAMMHRVATPAERPAGAPEYADVCFRYGWTRPSYPTVEDAKQAMRAFHATRVDWFYPGPHAARAEGEYVDEGAKQFIDWCHAHDMKIGGAINTLTTNMEWKLRPWNDSTTRYLGDPSNRDYVDAAVAWGKAQIDAGVDVLVCDDFFKYKGAEKKAFSEKVIETIQAYKRGFKIASNSGHFVGTDYVKPYAFDFHYSDSNFHKFRPSPSHWWAASKAHRELKSAFLIHPNRPMSKQDHRKLIALGYATGSHVIAPWDQFMSGASRFFGKPEDFADLYGFARALGGKKFLNGYEDAAVGGYDLKETRYGKHLPIAVEGGSGKLSVFARARPGNPQAPVVLHLIEGGEAKAARIKLQPKAFFTSGELKLYLSVPPAYDAAAHNKAAESGDFSTLAQTVSVPTQVERGFVVAEIPALNPWGVLVVERGK